MQKIPFQSDVNKTTENMKKKFFVTLIVIFMAIPSILVLALAWTGFFSNTELVEKKMGPYFMVYEDHKGAYKGTADIMDDIYYQLLEEDNIEAFKGFGIYFDNPKETAEEELRSLAGCIVETADTAKVKALGNKYKIMEIPERRYVTAEIRHRGQLSIFAGIVKVYPSIEKYMKGKNYPSVPAMEIYDRNKTIIYLFEIKE